MTCVLASELFEWFPYGDLIEMEEPEPDETIREYCSRISHDPHSKGDSLFDYLLEELMDTDRDETVQYVDSAISCLTEVRAKLAASASANKAESVPVEE